MTITRDSAEGIVARLIGPNHRLVGPNRTFNIAEFALRVREATTWCSDHADPSAPGSCLRPHRLRPSTLPTDRWDAVNDVATRRRREPESSTRFEPALVSEGRFLLYFPDDNLSCRTAEIASGDFFDGDNAPPCATWIGFFEDPAHAIYSDRHALGALLAWVPSALMPHAERGVQVNPEKCIQWLDADPIGTQCVAVNLASIVAHLESVGWHA